MTICGTTAAPRARGLAGGALWTGAAAVTVTLLALILSGCSPGNSTRLPELSSIPRKLLSAEEQKKVVDELQKRRETHREEAIE